MSGEKFTRGQFIPVEGQILPALELDCSNSPSDVPPDQWTRGQFTIVESEILPTLEFDFSTRDQIRLAISVDVEPSADSLANGIALLKLMESFNELDRNLGGAGWKLESASRNNGTVILLVAPVDLLGAQNRFQRIADAANQGDTIRRPDNVTSFRVDIAVADSVAT